MKFNQEIFCTLHHCHNSPRLSSQSLTPAPATVTDFFCHHSHRPKKNVRLKKSQAEYKEEHQRRKEKKNKINIFIS